MCLGQLHPGSTALRRPARVRGHRLPSRPSTSDTQTQTVQFTVDTVAPDAPVLTGTEGLTNGNDLSYQVTLPEGTAECRLIGPGDPTPGLGTTTTVTATVDFADVADGDYTFEVRTVDTAENRSPVSSLDATVDTDVNVTIDSAPATAIPTPVRRSSSARPRIRTSPTPAACSRPLPLRKSSPAFEACGSPFVTPFLDTNVRHRFEVNGVDPAGNETSRVRSSGIRTTPLRCVPPPDVTVEAGETRHRAARLDRRRQRPADLLDHHRSDHRRNAR